MIRANNKFYSKVQYRNDGNGDYEVFNQIFRDVNYVLNNGENDVVEIEIVENDDKYLILMRRMIIEYTRYSHFDWGIGKVPESVYAIKSSKLVATDEVDNIYDLISSMRTTLDDYADGIYTHTPLSYFGFD